MNGRDKKARKEGEEEERERGKETRNEKKKKMPQGTYSFPFKQFPEWLMPYNANW